MLNPDQDSKISLENLLRLKRAEQPRPEFWLNFEKELRQKQLTALVQKRRWWHELPFWLNRRICLAAGAAAIIAFTLVTVQYSLPARFTQVANMGAEIITADPPIEVLAATEVSDSVPILSGRHEESGVTASTPVPAAAVSHVAVASAAIMSLPRDAEAPATRAMVANFARLEHSETDLLDSNFGSHWDAPARLQPPAVVQSEVAAMTAAASSKYRLIARYADRSLSPAPVAPALVRERLARRLGEDLGDDISRIGVVGSRVSLKF